MGWFVFFLVMGRWGKFGDEAQLCPQFFFLVVEEPMLVRRMVLRSWIQFFPAGSYCKS